MTRWVVGDTVSFGPMGSIFHDRVYSGSHKVLGIREVPKCSLSGVGHTQWITVELGDGIHEFSGLFFEQNIPADYLCRPATPKWDNMQ